MRKQLKIIGNAFELEDGTLIRANDFLIEINDSVVRGDYLITMALHQLKQQQGFLNCPFKCSICENYPVNNPTPH